MQQSEILTLGIGLISVPSSCSILDSEKVRTVTDRREARTQIGDKDLPVQGKTVIIGDQVDRHTKVTEPEITSFQEQFWHSMKFTMAV